MRLDLQHVLFILYYFLEIFNFKCVINIYCIFGFSSSHGNKLDKIKIVND